MPIDLSGISDDALKQMYAAQQNIQKLESNNAPDSSTITNPQSGAQGSMQVMPATQTRPGLGVTPSNGTPEDTAREGRDYLAALTLKYNNPLYAAMAYNWGTGHMDKWIASGSDMSKVPDETLKYAYAHAQAGNGSTMAPQQSQPQAATPVPTDVSQMSDADLKAAYAKQQQVKQPDAAQQRGLSTIAAMKPNTESIGNAVTGMGENMANMMTGFGSMVGGGLAKSAAAVFGKDFYQKAEPTIDDIQSLLTYQPKTVEGLKAQQRLGDIWQQGVDILKQGANTAMSGIPFVGEDLAKSTQAHEWANTAAEVVANVAPMILGLKAGEARPKPPGAPSDAISKLVPPDDATPPSAQSPAEFVGPYQEGGGPLQGQPNAGPQQQFIVNDRGIASRPNEPVSMEQAGAEMGRDLYESKLAQKRLAETPAREYNTIEARAGDLIEAPIEQSDPTSNVSHPQESVPADRVAAPEEFTQAVTSLAEKAPDKFSVPADMDRAYDQYTKIVSGDLEPGPMADRFAKAVAQQLADDRLAAHPTIKANQARVNNLQAALDDARSKQAPTRALQQQLDRAQQTLDKAKTNIGKVLGADPYAPKVNNGVVQMYTFGHLPSVMKSIGAVLKALHGVVFKSLDRLLPSFQNLDSTAKILGQGIKNVVSREANRDWSQTVNEKPMNQFGKVPGLRGAVEELNPHAQEELSPEQLKQQFNQAPDLSDSKVGNFLRNNLLQGGLMLSDFSRHPLVKYVTDSVAKSFRSADQWTRDNLLNPKTGLGPMMRRMSKQDFTAIRTLMEAYEGVKEFTESELRGRGYSDDAIKYYTRSLELQKEDFQKYNESRVSIGLKPIDPRIAHIASYFTGDFKQIVKDSQGRIVAVLGHNTRFGLAAIAQRFKELHPDGDSLDFGKPTLNKHVAGGDNSFSGFMHILEQLSETNADVGRMVQAYNDIQMLNINKLGQMANRAKFKSNAENTVGGAEGSKLWQSLEKNAEEGGKQQLKYLESVNRWSEFQKAISKSTDFIKDPEVNAPNAKAVSQAYLDNQMHRNLGDLNKFTNAFVNGVADLTGVGPTAMRGMANFTKTGLLNMFVGLGKLSHSLVTMLQPIIGSPLVTSTLKARGAEFGLAQATSVFKAMGSVRDILQSLATKSPIKDPFVRAASQYARENDTFNTSQFNMGNVNNPPTKLGTSMHVSVTVPESGARTFVYMRYVHLLKDVSDKAPEGERLSDREIFGTAHNAVQKVMADYNREAQAPIYNKMGFLGDLTRMLTTFKMNQLSQAATTVKTFREGHVAPMVTMLATSIASSGLRGFIGYNIANGALGQITTWAAKQGLMTQPTNLDQILLHMLHGMNTHLADVLNFGATSALGIDMTGSLSHADDIPDDPLGTLIPEGGTIGKALGSAVQFAEHPNTQRGKALLYDVLPNSMKGAMENLAYTNIPGGVPNGYYDPHTGNLVAVRSPLDQAKRYATFRPLDESKMRLQAETARGQDVQLASVRSEITKRMLSDADSLQGNVGDIRQFAQKYAKEYFQQGQGDPSKLVQSLADHLGMQKHLNIEQRQAGIPSDLESSLKYKRSQELK